MQDLYPHVAIQIAWKRLLIRVIQSLGYSVTFYLASEQFYMILLNGWNHNNWWPWGCLSFAESFLNVLQTLYWHSNCCYKYSTFSAIQKKLVNSRLPIFAYLLIQCTHSEYVLFLMFCERKLLPKELAMCFDSFFCACMI